jgi:thiosulfate dehydrogenase
LLLAGTSQPAKASEHWKADRIAVATKSGNPEADKAGADQHGRAMLQDAAVVRGEYLARLGDCGACHTAPGGKFMAGGLPMATPFGTVHATNITPDRQSGIGSYSFEQFEQALRHGIRGDGARLYPVMPFPSFARITDTDLHDLYDYFMRGVAPVAQENRANTMRWPFSIRLGLLPWSMVFAREAPFTPRADWPAQRNRGAYLVQGLGHCGACHTPRGIAFQEKSLADDGSDDGNPFLSGSSIDAWHAPDLRGLWSPDQIQRFLKTGSNDHATAFGSMAEVVHHSSQHFSDTDLSAIADFLGALARDPRDRSLVADSPRPVDEGKLYGSRGGLGYVQFCSACHRLDGKGVPGIFPPLAGNTTVAARDASSAVHVVLAGGASPETAANRRVFHMPAYARLGDAELSEILNFVRGAWGNAAPPLREDEVGWMRKQIGAAAPGEDTFHTPRFADLLNQDQAARLVRGLRLMTQTRATAPDHVGGELSCGSCHLNGGSVAMASPFVGVSALFPLYAPRAGREIEFADRINACYRRSMNGKPFAKDSEDMQAMLAFAAWMRFEGPAGSPIPGRGVGKIPLSVKPDARHGKQVYGDQCAACHGDDGQGLRAADGHTLLPPLWGAASFNIGAGMARTYTAAAFVKNNMPVAQSTRFPLGQGGLSDQDAVDVAEYFTHMSRPDYPDKRKDWPKGGKPKDARY